MVLEQTHTAQTLLAGIGITVISYQGVLHIYRRWPRIWCSPLILTPLFLVALLSVARLPYQSYLLATRPLLWMVGPLTLAFAVPVHQHRNYIKRWWPALIVSTLVSSVVTMSAALLLARWCGLPDQVVFSIIGRSISLPFAFAVSNELGGVPSLTALFVVISGIVGIVTGETILGILRIKTDQASGATLGAIAQVVGVARAHEHSVPRGVMASLTMIFSGAISVVFAPLLLAVL